MGSVYGPRAFAETSNANAPIDFNRDEFVNSTDENAARASSESLSFIKVLTNTAIGSRLGPRRAGDHGVVGRGCGDERWRHEAGERPGRATGERQIQGRHGGHDFPSPSHVRHESHAIHSRRGRHARRRTGARRSAARFDSGRPCFGVEASPPPPDLTDFSKGVIVDPPNCRAKLRGPFSGPVGFAQAPDVGHQFR